ncbi:uncharacterized protein F5891DRAFT_1034102 [Suillus fuscotomentosus]|uniref:Secreted protein n=1 Tax=Suillus fuscotomentosus TaxID=1912939 RepID=A0AAD4HB01_9AGAM|nr:uncharacterized protein F5891DRAFT_1084301 [Suillus fuscotomentosus]XP_041226026.1 uncharacterized protein F5891DRAFT_1034102 [Suillus fuscotomentosus]KAG1886319.1 hypothetical protein F5891DRAFT_1084301 [Suillus fuscotomentosus]KAG1900450.1 hypothetical protein F5891DRAFT_1034102 [Suillus fuscotomentosus]
MHEGRLILLSLLFSTSYHIIQITMAERCAAEGCTSWAVSASRYCDQHKPAGAPRDPQIRKTWKGLSHFSLIGFGKLVGY